MTWGSNTKEDSRSEIYPVVTISDWEMLCGEEGYVPSGEPAHGENALTWVLEAMHLYAFDLGLIREMYPSRKNRKGE